ncbi:MAG TPA: aspartate aminotransferase family protein [Chitinophagales bacterium]|nr:aspartate aminotransferase family protein [Chitinophagales bacterium]
MLSNRQLFLWHVAQTSPAPLMLEIERAQGMYMYDTSGKQYLDLIAGISVSNLGHSHPKVVEAVKLQAEKYMHLMVYGEFVQSPQVLLAQKLVSLLPEGLNSVYFTNSGAEATEGTMKLAKRITGRTQFISFKNAYHGSTQGALSIIGDEYFKRQFRPLLPDTLALPYGVDNELNHITNHTAAVIIEPVQAESGVTVPTKEYIKLLRKKCDETGALLIFDEAQTGLGRTGKLFGFEHYSVVPDILLLAKALGGGMPLGAFITARGKMNLLTENPVLGHITTFGGHPVSCAAGLAALNVLVGDNIVADVEAKGKLFEELLARHGLRIRRSGLMMAVEFESFEQNKKIIDRCIENGVLTDWFLFAPHCMRIAPPLIISRKEIESACAIIVAALD